VTLAEVACPLVPSVLSSAKTWNVPAALNVTWKERVPAFNEAVAGRVALASEERIEIALVTVVTVAQVSSHARTVTVNGTPATCAVGVPVLPLPVPGAADSPGSSTCSRVYGPAIAADARRVCVKSASPNKSHAPCRFWRTASPPSVGCP
jgi:hypothetical protein